MAKFIYRAKDQSGEDVQGEMDLATADMVATKLIAKGYMPISVLPKPEDIFEAISKYISSATGVKAEELIIFTRQLASILSAGVPFLESLDAVSEQVQSKYFKDIVIAMRRDVEGGVSFSEALSKHKKVFNSIFISMVHSGEKAGILSEVLERLADLLERDFDNVQKIKSAMRYPIMVVGALVVAFAIIITFVVPQFSKLYSSFGTELPLPTKILIWLNYISVTYWYLIIAFLGAVFYALKRFLSTEYGIYLKDKVSISVPIFGPLIKKLILSRFTRMLSAMLKSGIPIIEALDISKDTLENRIMSDVVIKVKGEVVKGNGLAEPMRDAKIFPPLVVQMVAIGEKSGSMESMLTKVADYFDRDADYAIKNLTPLIEPLLILVLAFFVVLLALGVFLPMWDMVKLIKN